MSAKIENAPAGVLQVRKIGNSLGLLLPKELAARLDFKAGDKLHLVEAADRVLKLSPYDPAHVEAMEIARRSFRDYANTYKALAK